jgi:glycosyltransferase involved in cell wall biosynthesis
MRRHPKGLLIYPISTDHPANRGILNKMAYQSQAFEELGADVDVMCNSRSGPVFGGKLVARYPITGRWFDSLNHYGTFYRHAKKQADLSRYDFLYIRYPLALPSFLLFLRQVRKANPRLKIVAEIATYPYRRELDTPKRRVLLGLDLLGRGQLKRFLDRIVTFYGQSEIHGVPCFQLSNGVDVRSMPLRQRSGATEGLTLVTVGNVAERHGLDRVLRGLAAYGDQPDGPSINLDIIGDGPAIAPLKKLSNDLGLRDSVRFLGIQHGAELDASFDRADVALDSLAIHRLQLPCSSSLKAREYCARGIPFVIASDDPDFPSNLPFVHRAPSNDGPIDIQGLVQFHASLCESHPDVTAEMRQYAEQHLTWTAKLEPLLEYLRSEELEGPR